MPAPLEVLVSDNANIFEVGPRDGLQNESIILPVAQKLELIQRLVQAGATNIEIGSFVHPKWVPQMADTDTVARSLEKIDGVRYWALVPNAKGLERAIDTGLKHVAVFMSSSETHNQRNINRSIADSLVAMRDTISLAKQEGIQVRAYISTVFGCPYEGHVDFDKVLNIGDKLLELGAFQISLGDTTGMGQPLQVKEGSRRAIAQWGTEHVALHLHDTRGLGQTNAFAGFIEGIRNFDSSVGGLGGCPYAPGAPGNLSTENLLGLLDAMNVQSGINPQHIRETSNWLESSIGFSLKH